MAYRSKPPKENDDLLDDPFESMGVAKETGDTDLDVLRMGFADTASAYRMIKDETLGNTEFKRFMSRRYGQEFQATDSEANQVLSICRVIGNQAGREAIQNACIEKVRKLYTTDMKKATTTMRKTPEVRWMSLWMEQRASLLEQAGCNEGVFAGAMDIDERTFHPKVSAPLINALDSFAIGSDAPAIILRDQRATINQIFFDMPLVGHLDESARTLYNHAVLGVSSLLRSSQLITSYQNVWLPEFTRKTQIRSPSSLSPSGTTLQIDNYTTLLNMVWKSGHHDQLKSVIGEIDKASDRLLRQRLNNAYETFIDQCNELYQEAYVILGDWGEELEISEDIGKFVDSIQKILDDAKAVDIDQIAIEGAETIEANRRKLTNEVLTPLRESKRKIVDIGKQYEKLSSNEEGLSLKENSRRMLSLSDNLDRWIEDNSRLIRTPADISLGKELVPFQANDPIEGSDADNNDAVVAEESNPASDEGHRPSLTSSDRAQPIWTDEDVDQLESEIESLRSQKSKLESKVDSLQSNLEARKAGNQEGDEIIGDALKDYVLAPSSRSVLDLLESTYADRLRILPSAKESIDASTSGVRDNALMQKLTGLVTDGLDAFRSNVPHLEINEIIPGELKLNESETIANNDQLRRLRQFQDGDRLRTMYKHLSIDGINRIYFEYDDDEKKIVVGYIGKHLPGAKNPTT